MSEITDGQHDRNYEHRDVPTFLIENDHDCREEQCHLDSYPRYHMDVSPVLGAILFRRDSCRQMSIVTSYDDAVLAAVEQGKFLVYPMDDDMEQLLSAKGIVGSASPV